MKVNVVSLTARTQDGSSAKVETSLEETGGLDVVGVQVSRLTKGFLKRSLQWDRTGFLGIPCSTSFRVILCGLRLTVNGNFRQKAARVLML